MGRGKNGIEFIIEETKGTKLHNQDNFRKLLEEYNTAGKEYDLLAPNKNPEQRRNYQETATRQKIQAYKLIQ